MSRKGGSGLNGGGAGGGNSVTHVTTQGGNVLDLSSMPLVYGQKDPAVTGALRQAMEAQEKKRADAKIEYGLGVRADGSTVSKEYKGNKNSCPVPSPVFDIATTFTHNHPRGKGEEGLLGGTFSQADLKIFGNKKVKTFRASAAEGTYSISKGQFFDRLGFFHYQTNLSNTEMKAHSSRKSSYLKDVANKKITYDQYIKKCDSSFNKMLVNVHNGLLAGQKTYGYTYTLEAK